MWPIEIGTESGTALTHIHKMKDRRDIYFFASSQDTPVEAKVTMRVANKLAARNPRTGERHSAGGIPAGSGGLPAATVRLKLDPASAVFYVEE